jgi:DNA replication and repair protein RecF
VLEEADRLDRLVHHVDGIIHGLDEILDVAAIERRDETQPHRLQHFAGNVIRLVFQCYDALAVAIDILAGKKGVQRLRAADDRSRVAREHVEELIFAGQQFSEEAEHSGSLPVALDLSPRPS